jgi:iron-sulfur cluster assembly protein
MIKVSDHAKEKAIQLMTEEGFKPFEDYIRVGVKSGGCSGLEYVLKFDNEKADADQVFEDNGIKIIVEKKSILYVSRNTLEYSGCLNGKAFIFNTPHANRTCGCGESFSL